MRQIRGGAGNAWAAGEWGTMVSASWDLEPGEYAVAFSPVVRAQVPAGQTAQTVGMSRVMAGATNLINDATHGGVTQQACTYQHVGTFTWGGGKLVVGGEFKVFNHDGWVGPGSRIDLWRIEG